MLTPEKVNSIADIVARMQGAGVVEVAGKSYMPDVKGALVPVALVKPVDKLIDQTVRKLMAFADDLSGQISRFRGHSFDDVATLQDLIAEDYGSKVGGAKGNITLSSFDGLMKVTVQVADRISFGPELQVAKALIDECIAGWAEGAGDEIRALVNHAFQVDKEGQINRSALFQLRRIDIDDDRWRNAVRAIGESIRVIGSKAYIRFYRRPSPDAAWSSITIDLAAA